MSSPDGALTQADRDLLAHIDEEIGEAEDEADYEAVATLLRNRFENHRAEFRAFQRDVEDRLSALEDGHAATEADAAPHTLAKFAAMPEEERAELLGATDQRAVSIYEHWDDLAEQANAGYVISTRRSSTTKHGTSKLRTDLNKIFDEDLEWTQIYRAMKAVARLSGGQETADDWGRTHIYGGAWEFHEKPTPDASDTHKVLVEADSR